MARADDEAGTVRALHTAQDPAATPSRARRIARIPVDNHPPGLAPGLGRLGDKDAGSQNQPAAGDLGQERAASHAVDFVHLFLSVANISPFRCEGRVTWREIA